MVTSKARINLIKINRKVMQMKKRGWKMAYGTYSLRDYRDFHWSIDLVVDVLHDRLGCPIPLVQCWHRLSQRTANIVVLGFPRDHNIDEILSFNFETSFWIFCVNVSPVISSHQQTQV